MARTAINRTLSQDQASGLEEGTLAIVRAELMDHQILKLKFNNGFEGLVDLAEKIASTSIGPWHTLADPAIFQHFKLDHGTVCWPNEFDVAPEYFYFLANKNNPTLQTLFRKWGYLN